MNLVKFIEILSSKIIYLIVLPLVVGALTYFLTKDLPSQYACETTVYTGITSNTGLDINAPKVDKLTNQNDYNNVMSLFKSQAIYEEISLRLLASHLILKKADKEIISEEAFNDLKNTVPDRVRKMVVPGDAEATYQVLAKSVRQDSKDYLYGVMNYTNPYYSISALSTMKVEQINSSDMLRISYQSNDPGICFNTVKITSEVFISKYGDLKKNIRSSAVKYFQDKLNEVAQKLNNSENKLLEFNINNNIINYYEQTRQVTKQNEEIELRLQDVKMNYQASDAVLKKIEAEISKRFSINLKNVEILNIRTKLVECNNSIADYETNTEKNAKDFSVLSKRKISLEKKLENCIDSLYNYNSNSQGIDSQKLLANWLEAVTNYETFKARFKSMMERWGEFQKEYQRYAPLGATTKRIEREIHVQEDEYINVLNYLNIALQNEKNIEMISQMRIIDEPHYPITSLPSKKKIYIIAAALFTLIFYILGIFSIELMDKRVKTPALLKRLAGWDVIAAFCLQNSKKFLNTAQINHKAALFIYEKIRSLSHDQSKPFVIQLVSNWDGAGKIFTAGIIEEELTKRGFRVKTILFKSQSKLSETNEEASEDENIRLSRSYLLSDSYAELAQKENLAADYLITIIPSICGGIDNSVLLKSAQLTLVVFNADLTWGEADEYNTNKIKQLTNRETYSILTNAMPNNVEELYGEIEKKRSKFRILIKKTLKRFTH